MTIENDLDQHKLNQKIRKVINKVKKLSCKKCLNTETGHGYPYKNAKKT